MWDDYTGFIIQVIAEAIVKSLAMAQTNGSSVATIV